MAKKQKIIRPKARVPKGLRDINANEIRGIEAMLQTIRQVYESFGFEPLDTPVFEYSDALGKFLPDQDRPNEGVFSFEDEDGQWVSLRYDLTAPLARHVAQNYDALAKPFRRYQTGYVYRNEKPGPGRFRQFTQFDADTVGTPNIAADAELCMLAASTLDALGISQGQYVVKVNNRKILDGVLQAIGLDGAADDHSLKRLTILRAIDKLDRLGPDGVALLLGPGRKDESGDFTEGASLDKDQIDAILRYVSAKGAARNETLKNIELLIGDSAVGHDGLEELRHMDVLLSAAGFAADQVTIDPAIVRGLGYYTGPVFEAELNLEQDDEDGRPTAFGSVGGGGRYDGLVARFKGVEVPATGFSIGVSRLYTALRTLGALNEGTALGPVIVLVMDHDRAADYQKFTMDLRKAGIRSEMYLGTSGMKAQMKYADKRCSPCVIIQGEDERQKGEVTIKDLIRGAELSLEITDNTEWREGRPAQFCVKEEELVAAVSSVLERYL